MSNLFTRYAITIRPRRYLAGGTPKDPKVIEGWIKTRLGLPEGEQLKMMVARTMQDLGHDLNENPTVDELEKAIAATVADKSTNGFKVRGSGPTRELVIEGRIVKACLKESSNVVWSGQRFGPTRKFAKGYVAERIFVLEDELGLGRAEPDAVHLFIGHVPSAKGEQSTLTYYEMVERPTITFTVASLHDCLSHAQWEELMEHAELNGLGSLRSQSYGTFDLIEVRPVAPPKRPRFFGGQAVQAARDEGLDAAAVAELEADLDPASRPGLPRYDPEAVPAGVADDGGR